MSASFWRVGSGKRTTVDLVFRADRNQLFTAWNALANLGDLAGNVDVNVRAVSEAGFDENELENGVREPLRETKFSSRQAHM